MDKKLNFTDLSVFFSKVCGISAGDAEIFVHAFFDVIVEGLEKDGIVKINGLGTFKVLEVESRSSINISTGERFEIDGHKRLTFIPSDSLKEVINAPFAMFEPVEVDDDIDDEGDEKVSPEENIYNDIDSSEEGIDDEELLDSNIETLPETQEQECEADEVVVSVSDIEEEMPCDFSKENGQTVTTENIEEELPIEVSDYIPVEIVSTEVAVGHDEKTESAILKENIDSEENNVALEQIENVYEEKTNIDKIVPSDNEITSGKKEIIIPDDKGKIFFDTLLHEKKKKKSFALPFIILALFICVVGGAGYYFYVKNLSKSNTEKFAEKNIISQQIDTNIIDSAKKNVAAVVDSVKENNDSLINAANDTLKETQQVVVACDDSLKNIQHKVDTKNSEKFILVDALAVRELSKISVADTMDYNISGTACEHNVMQDETLIRLSLKYYGDKRLWPYIVKYNNMSRPNDLACDMLLKIPILTPRK